MRPVLGQNSVLLSQEQRLLLGIRPTESGFKLAPVETPSYTGSVSPTIIPTSSPSIGMPSNLINTPPRLVGTPPRVSRPSTCSMKSSLATTWLHRMFLWKHWLLSRQELSEKKLRRQAVKFRKVDGSRVWIFPLLLCISSFCWEAVGGRNILVAGNSSVQDVFWQHCLTSFYLIMTKKNHRKIRLCW